MNTKQTLKAAWSLYRVLGLVMILSMVFAAPLVVMAWTEAVPPDAEPGTIVTIKVGDDDVVQYDKDLPIEVFVEGPNGYMPPCVEVGWGWDDLAEQEVWTCEIELDADPAVAVGEYKYVILQAGVLMDQGFFTDNKPAASLEQCRNGTAANPSDCLELGGNLGWVNGNAGASNSHHAEGYSIPYRIILTNLPIGETVTLTLGYDIRHSSKTALDFLTSYDRQEPHMPIFGHPAHIIDPTSGVSGIAATNSTYPIPAPPNSVAVPGVVGNQPITRFNSLPADEKLMSLYGGTITGMAYVNAGNFTLSNSEAQVSVTFTPAGSTAVLAFGGHIARCQDWGKTGGVCNSAAGISGSPYHMRLKGWNIGNLGSQDRSLAASAVVSNGTIRIIKDAVPDSAQLFEFSMTGQPNFFLKDDGVTDNYIDFDLTAGIYTVTELGPPVGWTLTNLVCVDPTTNTTVSLASRQAVINVAPGETVTCTFTNTKQAKLTIVKNAIGGNGTFNFTSAKLGPFSITTVAGTGSQVFNNLAPDTYAVAETVPTGWDLTSATCSNGNPVNAIVLGPGADVTCTFVDTKLAKLTIVKNTVGGNGTFNFTSAKLGAFSITTAAGTGSQVFNNLPLDTYAVAETVPAGWVLTSATCSNGNPVNAIVLGAGADVTCTFVNSKLPTLTLVKTVQNNYGGTKTVADFPLFIGATPAVSGTAYTLTPGTYVASETQQFGYTASPWGGHCAANGSVTLAYGDNKTCTITNSDIQPKLYVIKVVNNMGVGTKTPADFTMHVTGVNVTPPTSFPGQAAPGKEVFLHQGAYMVTETVDPMYSVHYSADCNGTIMVGQTKTCTVTNTLMVPGWTPGFWRNHGPGAPHGKDAWQYTAFETSDLLDEIFDLGMIAGLPVKGSATGFIDKTLMEALRFRGGGGLAGAGEILLRAAVASLLNASFAEEYGAVVPGLFFPMTVDEVIEAVDLALASGNRTTMLTLAAELDYINNGSWDFPWHLLP